MAAMGSAQHLLMEVIHIKCQQSTWTVYCINNEVVYGLVQTRVWDLSIWLNAGIVRQVLMIVYSVEKKICLDTDIKSHTEEELCFV
jgi:hypothetical protein